MALNSFLQSTAGALQIAGTFSGVPYASAAGTLLSGIIDASQQIIAHKAKCSQLAEKCNCLKIALEENSAKLVGTDLQASADEMMAILQRVNQRTRKYKQYGKVKSFMKMGVVEKGLDKCTADLDNALSIFSLNANVVIHNTQHQTLDVIRSSTSNTEELLMQILNNQDELREVVVMQNQGHHVAERLMEAGQLRMQKLYNTGTSQSPRSSLDRYEKRFPQARNMIVADRRTTSSPPPIPERERESLQRGLYELHKLTGVPPTVKILDGEVSKIGDLAVTGGTYSDIWEGTWMGREKVALKALRNVKASDEKARRRFETEIRVWDRLSHPHILRFYGLVTNLGQIHMVSPWQDFGNVLEYVKTHKDTNRIHLLSGAAEGIRYLHECHIVHGNLKCANVLVSRDGEARICDFGMSTVIEQVTETSASATLTAAGSARWLAPELIEGSTSSPTMPADIYSFAMAILELLTEKHPFSDVRRDASVIHRIVVQKRMPSRPDGPEAEKWLTGELWDLMQGCWSPEAGARPSMKLVAERMRNIEADLDISMHTS